LGRLAWDVNRLGDVDMGGQEKIETAEETFGCGSLIW
jgi:hypothetical protein